MTVTDNATSNSDNNMISKTINTNEGTVPIISSSTVNNNNNDDNNNNITNGMTAADFKELGNQAFGEKRFEDAIQYYTDAIKRDPNNHVYYSNRSASYVGLATTSNSSSKPKNDILLSACDDAKDCIRLDPSFLKGYYRLATAQVELRQYDSAAATVRQGLAIDKGNIQLTKLLQSIAKLQKAHNSSSRDGTSVTNSSTPAQRQQQQQSNASLSNISNIPSISSLDAASLKELQELQLTYQQLHRELNTVQAHSLKAQREYQLTDLTNKELFENSPPTSSSNCPSETNATVPSPVSGTPPKYYRSIGKMFMVQKSAETVQDHLQRRLSTYKKEEETMEQKMQYLQSKITSCKRSMEELLSSSLSASNNATAPLTQ